MRGVAFRKRLNIEEKSKESLADKVLTKIGLKAIDVYAQDYSSSSDYLKKTMMIYPVTTEGQVYYRMTYVCNWITMPQHRSFELVSFNWSNDVYYDANSAGAENTFVKYRCAYDLEKLDLTTGE